MSGYVSYKMYLQDADKKAHTFSWKSKNVKKTDKKDEKRILCKFTFKMALNNLFVLLTYYIR